MYPVQSVKLNHPGFIGDILIRVVPLQTSSPKVSSRDQPRCDRNGKVVQDVAASPEETASTSEELSAQAEEMLATVRRLKEFVGGAKKESE